MPVTNIQPAQQPTDLTTVRRQREEMKAEEEKKAREKADQAKIQRDAEQNQSTQRSVLPKENLGRKIDINA
jgi:hypothetical protein